MNAHSSNYDAGGAGAWRQASLFMADGFDMAVECGRTGLLIVDEALSHVVF